jgi:hypothetical protein
LSCKTKIGCCTLPTTGLLFGEVLNDVEGKSLLEIKPELMIRHSRLMDEVIATGIPFHEKTESPCAWAYEEEYFNLFSSLIWKQMNCIGITLMGICNRQVIEQNGRLKARRTV